MRLINILVFFILTVGYGCSSLEKCIYLKPSIDSENWVIKRNKNYRGYYDSETHYYYSCDSLSSIRITFTNRIKPIMIGPPLIPFLPSFGIKPNLFQISISLKTNNDTDLVTISNFIHIKFNDTLQLAPNERLLDNKQQQWNIEFHKSICDNHSLTNKYLWILNRYDITPDKVKTLTITFDKGLNQRLGSNYKTLKLKRKNRLHYNTIFFPAS